MSDPPKIFLKSKVSIQMDDDEVDRSLSPTLRREQSLNRSASPNAEADNRSASNFRRQSRKRRSSRKSDANVESITLQESTPKNPAVTLKASFLKRKIKEYEGM